MTCLDAYLLYICTGKEDRAVSHSLPVAEKNFRPCSIAKARHAIVQLAGLHLVHATVSLRRVFYARTIVHTIMGSLGHFRSEYCTGGKSRATSLFSEAR